MSGVRCHILFQSTEAATERAMKEAQCDHLRAAVLFIKELDVARVRLEGMLGSATTTDVVEALRFFVTVRSAYADSSMSFGRDFDEIWWRSA